MLELAVRPSALIPDPVGALLFLAQPTATTATTATTAIAATTTTATTPITSTTSTIYHGRGVSVVAYSLAAGSCDRLQVVGMGEVKKFGLRLVVVHVIIKFQEGFDRLEIRQQARDELAELGAVVSLAASLDQHFGQVWNIGGPLDDVVVGTRHGRTVKAFVGP